jgi:hypothetical protein
MEEIIKRLNRLENELAEQRKYTESIILANTSLIQEIANNIDVKLDILCNIEKPAPSATKSAKNVKVQTKNVFFKNKLKNNINEYIDVLYTADDIKELYEHPDVTKLKTEVSRKNKVIDMTYAYITKTDKAKNILLTNIYEKYKSEVENDDDDNISET